MVHGGDFTYTPEPGVDCAKVAGWLTAGEQSPARRSGRSPRTTCARKGARVDKVNLPRLMSASLNKAGPSAGPAARKVETMLAEIVEEALD